MNLPLRIEVPSTTWAALLLLLSATLLHGVDVETETMTLSGPYAGSVSSPFAGVQFYGNGDQAATTVSFSDAPGRYRVDIRGASDNTSSAAVTLLIDGTAAGSATWTSPTPTVQSIANVDITTGGSHAVVIRMTTDTGASNCLVDWISITRTGAIPPLPSAPVPATTGALTSGVWRNLFLESGRNQTEIDAKVDSAWQQFFYGDDANQRIYYPVGTDQAYIKDVHNNDVRSEGMSYGMMISVQLDKKTEFDRLWRWASTYMRHPTGEKRGYFAWKCSTAGSVMDPNPASDGEIYFATSLIFAHTRWGSAGSINYLQEARAIWTAMFDKEQPGEFDSTFNMFSAVHKQVTFTPYGQSANHTDPSYHLPAFYEIWRQVDTDRATFWAECAAASRLQFRNAANATTGLMPDYSNWNGTPYVEGGHESFRFDAWRCAMNVAMDHAWTAADPWQIEQSNRLLAFFASKGIAAYGNQWTLDGTQLDSSHSPGLVAMNAVAVLASNQASSWAHLNHFWDTPIPNGQYRYYDGCLYLFGLLHCSGKFRAYLPDSPVSAGTITVSASTASIAEGGGSVTVTARRTGGSAGAVSVAFATANGSATAGSDYTAASGTLSWAAGDSADKTFVVSIAQDTAVESNETFTATLSAPTGGASLGTPASVTVTIVDDDTAAVGTIALSASTASIAEGGGNVTVTARRTGGSAGAVTAAYATANGSASAGSDYTAASGTLSWAAGDSADKSFVVTITQDTVVESSETFTATLTAPTGGASLGTPVALTVTIGDDDVASGLIQAESMTQSGGGQMSAPFAGVVFYSNNDQISTSISLTDAPGRYRIDVRGAANASNPASVTVLVDGTAVGSVTWTNSTPAVKSIANVDILTNGSHPIILRMMTDTGASDAFVDWISITRIGAIPPLPSAPVPATTGALTSGVWRNLFLESGRNQTEIDAKVDSAWQQFFYGDDANQRIYYPVGTDQAYIKDVHNNDVRSEGMSYGMMISVQLDKKTEFDRLWRWASTYMRHPTGEKRGYFAWKCSTAGSVMDPNPASDGEIYFATSLIFAHTRWGSAGSINYLQEARAIWTAMFDKEQPGEFDSTFNMFSAVHKQVTFTPYGQSANHTDPSYHLPAFYEIWRQVDTDRATFWAECAAASRLQFRNAANATTGLMPDYSNWNGTPYVEGGHESFRFDAWRCAMNVAMDHAWTAADPWQIEQSNRLLAFFASKGIAAYGNQWTLDGTQLDSSHSPGLVAMNAVAVLASNQASSWAHLNHFWDTPIPNGQYRYYDGCLYLFGLLHCSGKFRAYLPDSPVSAGTITVSASTASIAEGGGSVTVTARRTGGSAGAVSVAFATANGSATAGSDYTAASGTLSWAAGDSADKTFVVSIAQDTAVESNETFTATLSAPTGGASLGTPASVTVTIVDDDTAAVGTIALSASTASIAEGGGNVTVTARRTGGSAGAVTAAYATANGSASAGSDYTAASGTLSWAAGDSADKTFVVAITQDSVVESGETFTATLSGLTGGATLGSPAVLTVTVLDDDTAMVPGTIALSASTTSIAEGGGSVTVTARRTGGSAGAVTAAYATANGSASAGSDYTAASGTLSWAAGDSADKSFVVTITQDTVVESGETFTATLSGLTGGATLGTPASLTVTIVDDDSTGRTPENPAGTVAGINYRFYTGTWSALPDFAALVAVKEGTLSNFTLTPRTRNDNFGFRFTGYLDVPAAGTWTLATTSDDGSRLWIGSTLVVDNDGLHGPQERSGTIALQAGRHALTVDFFEGTVGELLEVRWQGPGTAPQTIPASALRRVPAASPTVTLTGIDIGGAIPAGGSSLSGGVWTVAGGGTDIWGSADSFRFAHQGLTGDGEIVARVTGVQATDPWAKAGVMIRETTAANSRQVLVAATSGNGVAFQRRRTTAGTSVHTAGSLTAAPRWVRLVRRGGVFSGYESGDGENWVLISSDTIPMAASVRIGLGVTSHRDGTLCTATFDSIRITSAPSGAG